jgi:hypothetical protein
LSWYYTREPGRDGTILTEDGRPPGVDLATLLDRERPPLKAALEIGSALADILTIAEEDEVVHGDIKPGYVCVDAEGGISLEGFGQPRRTTRAPEGRPQGSRTDVFGLGVVLHSMLSSEPLGRLPRDPDAHDDAIVDRVVGMDFSQVKGRRWLEEVQQFLCSIMAHDLLERPEPLDAANVLNVVAEQCPGNGLAIWAARAVRLAGGGGGPASRAPIRETLDRPAAVERPMPRGSTGNFQKTSRQAPSTKGETTQFWTREKIDALMAEEDEEELAPPSPVRSSGGWGQPQPPAPRGGGGWGAQDEPLDGPTPVQPAWQPGSSSMDPPSWPSPGQQAAPPRPPAPPQRPAPPLPPRPPQPPPGSPARAPRGPMPSPVHPPIAQGPVASGPSAPPPPQPAEEEGNGLLKWVAIGLAVSFVLCLGVSAAGGAAWYVLTSRTVPAEVDAPATLDPIVEDDVPSAFDSDEPDPKDVNVEPEPDGASPNKSGGTTSSSTSSKKSGGTTSSSTSSKKSGGTTSSSTSSKKSGSTTSSSPSSSSTSSTSSSTPAATAVATDSYEAKISVASNDKVTMRCGDGQTKTFAGAVRLTFAGTVSCVLQAGDAKGVVTVGGPGQYLCQSTDDMITCASP